MLLGHLRSDMSLCGVRAVGRVVFVLGFFGLALNLLLLVEYLDKEDSDEYQQEHRGPYLLE